MKKLIIYIFLSFTYLSASVQCTSNACEVSKDMTFWGFNLYHFKYKVDKEGNEKITLTYKREIKKEKNVEKTIEKFSQNNKYTKQCKDLLAKWNSHLINVKEGTIYEVVVDSAGATMFIDKKKLFNTEQRLFGQKYIKIWSGNNPVDEDLRDKIKLAKIKVSKLSPN